MRGFSQTGNGAHRLATLCGILAGLLYVAWMVLLVLFVELLLDQGLIRATGPDARYAAELTGAVVANDTFIAKDTGLLPMVIESRGRWHEPALSWAYRNLNWTHYNWSYAIGLAVVAISIGVVRLILMHAQIHYAAGDATDIVSGLLKRIFKQKFDLGSLAFDREIRKDVEPLIRTKLPVVQRGLFAFNQNWWRETAKILGLLAFILFLNPLLGASFLIMAALAWLLGSGLMMRIGERRRGLAATAEDELEKVVGLVGKLRLIRGYAAEDYFTQQFGSHLTTFTNNTVKRLRYEGRVAPIWQFLGMLVLISIAALAAHSILAGRFALAGAAGVIASAVSIALPLRQILETRRSVAKADDAATEVSAFLDTPPGRNPEPGLTFCDPLAKAIEFNRVSYRDSNDRMLLDDVSIRIHAGQRIALISTSDLEPRAFLFLLCRFMDPTTGVIRYDDRQLSEFTIESLRSQVCTVLQSDLLFPDTVANNIGCGDISFTQQRIIEAAKVAHAHHFVQKLPRGYECMVGEGGFPLKIGERYRLALARAILRDPPVVAIEEPKETLDSESKDLLGDTMNRFFANRTVLIVPSRLSTLRSCDQVFLFDQGKLVACGSHRELLETSNLYRHLEYTRFQSHLKSAT